MAASRLENSGVAVLIHSLLGAHDGRRRLESRPNHDVLPVADAALYAAGAVGASPDSARVIVEEIVVFGAGHRDAAETGADLEALAGRQREHRLREVGLQLVEHRLAQTRRHSPRHRFDHAAQGVAVLAGLLDAFDDTNGHVLVGAARDVRFHLGLGDGVGVHLGCELPDLLDVADDFNAVVAGEQLLGDRSRGHSPDGLARARPAAALPVANAVFGVVGVIGVGGPVLGAHVLVVLPPSVLVPHAYEYGSAERQAVEHAGEYLRPVALLALRGNLALAGPAAVQFLLYVIDRQLEPGRAPVDHDAHGVAVGLAPGADLE